MTEAPDDPVQRFAELGPESVEDLYERAPCGYLVTDLDGTVVRANRTLQRWTGHGAGELVGRRRFADLLSPGGRIFYETHLAPLLALQGEARELAFDVVRADRTTMPVLVSATRVPATERVPGHDRITVFDATHRHEYEAELLRARKAAEASERQVRALAETLQRSLMKGGLTTGTGYRIETRYRPAVSTLEIGGDWHDSFLLDEGRTVAISVGDVVGRGITAACAMGQLRAGLRAIAGSGRGPGATLEQLDAFVDRLPDARFATIAYAEIDTTTNVMTYACAGHPPPLVVDASGSAAFEWQGRSKPVGLGTQGRPEATRELRDLDRVVLYTDGLIERRTRDIDDGFAALARVGSTLSHVPLDVTADRLLTELLTDEDSRDDVCLLCYEHR